MTRRARTGSPPVDRQLRYQVTRVRGLVEALMFDVAAWLAGAVEPVTPELNPGYAFNELRRLPLPRDRMRHYVSGVLLDSWGEVMDRWLERGLRLQPFFGNRLALTVDELDGPGPVKATFRFSNKSIILVEERREYLDGDWQVTVQISPDLKLIENCLLRPVSEGSQS